MTAVDERATEEPQLRRHVGVTGLLFASATISFHTTSQPDPVALGVVLLAGLVATRRVTLDELDLGSGAGGCCRGSAASR